MKHCISEAGSASYTGGPLEWAILCHYSIQYTD